MRKYARQHAARTSRPRGRHGLPPAAPVGAPAASPRARSASRPRWPATRRPSPTQAMRRQVLVFSYPLVGNYGVDQGRRRVVARLDARASSCGGPGRRGRPGSPDAGRRRARRRRHARARPPHPHRGRRCAARSATRQPEELHARALAEPHLDCERVLAVPACDATARRSRPGRPSRSRFGSGPRVVVARPRLQALDPPAPRGDGPRGGRRARARRTPTRSSSSTRRRCSSATARATRRSSSSQVETVRGAARARAALRHLPRAPARRPRARPADVQAALRPPRRQPSRAGARARAACS